MGGVLRVVGRHAAVLRRSNGRISWQVWGLHAVVPIALGALTIWQGPDIDNGVLNTLLATAGLFAAFSFGLAIQLFARATSLDDAGTGRSPKMTKARKLTGMIAGSAAYLSLTSIALSTAALIATMLHHGWPDRVANSITLALAAHLAATVSTITVRIFTLTTAHLRSASSEHPPSRIA